MECELLPALLYSRAKNNLHSSQDPSLNAVFHAEPKLSWEIFHQVNGPTVFNTNMYLKEYKKEEILKDFFLLIFFFFFAYMSQGLQRGDDVGVVNLDVWQVSNAIFTIQRHLVLPPQSLLFHRFLSW